MNSTPYYYKVKLPIFSLIGLIALPIMARAQDLQLQFHGQAEIEDGPFAEMRVVWAFGEYPAAGTQIVQLNGLRESAALPGYATTDFSTFSEGDDTPVSTGKMSLRLPESLNPRNGLVVRRAPATGMIRRTNAFSLKHASPPEQGSLAGATGEAAANAGTLDMHLTDANGESLSGTASFQLLRDGLLRLSPFTVERQDGWSLSFQATFLYLDGQRITGALEVLPPEAPLALPADLLYQLEILDSRDVNLNGIPDLVDTAIGGEGQFLGKFYDPILRQADGWAQSAWLGWLSEQGSYIFHLEHGWIYPADTEVAQTVTVYDTNFASWWWSSSSTYPWIYVYSGSHGPAWCFFYRGGGINGRDRWFFSAETGQFFSLGAEPVVTESFLDPIINTSGTWKQSQWYGWTSLIDEASQLYYHAEHRYQYIFAQNARSVWIFDAQLGWVYTTRDLYPWLYVLDAPESDGSGWFFYYVGGGANGNPRWFLNEQNGSFLRLP